MFAWVKGIGRFLLVTVGIVVLTSLGVDATQYLTSSQSALGIFATRLAVEDCPSDMVQVTAAGESFCVDRYEASVGELCPVALPNSLADTTLNMNDPACMPESTAAARPWVYVAHHQAAALCARAGKRLPTPQEWYVSGLGTPDGVSCNIKATIAATGNHPDCHSGSGVYDMIGNVWEFVDGEVVDGVWSGQSLPGEGYVAEIDTAGLATQTTTTPQALFNNDYWWHKSAGRFVVVRGGFYGSGEDAGIYSAHSAIAPTFGSAAIGFRCVSDVPM